MKTLVLMAAALMLATRMPAQVPSDDEIHKILVQRIDEYKQNVGIVVGVVDAKGRRIVSYGALDKGDTRTLNGDTVFEIGSITKAFDALVLADMADKKEVALTDPVAKYLPANVKVPERGGKQITLEDLATHTSGLPRLPANLMPKDPSNPYVDYTADRLYAFLSSYQLPRDIGAQFEYSNLGFGLLGHALERKAGMSFDDMIQARVAKPLGLKETRVKVTPEMQARFAVGHNDKLEKVPYWDFDVLSGAGALRSTTNDMLTFVSAALGYTDSPLKPAFATMLSVRRPSGTPNLESALGWQIFTPPSGDLVWKDGGTYGFGTFIGFDAKARVGVVVLSNTFTTSGALTGVDDIGLHLLNPAFPLNRPPQNHTRITLDSKILDNYVGRYPLAPAFVITVTREGSRLLTQATGQAQFEIVPYSEKDFFAQVGDIEVTFQTGADGMATGMILKQAGQQIPIRRETEAATPPAPK